jgi:POT family proton-dependent oligopeptide transporter
LDRQEWQSIRALLILFLPVTFFWATYEQQGNTIALWADEFTNRTIDLGYWRGEIPVTWFQAVNPFMIFAFTPLVVALWRRQSESGREPTTLSKQALGLLGVVAANLVMAFAAWTPDPGGKSSWLWLLAYFAVITVGELYLSPTGLSLVSKIAPPKLLSMMMGLWLATSFAGNLIQGWLGSFWTRMDKPAFFLMIAGIAGIAALVIRALERPLQPLLREE